jgi:benzodiazapine receptor
MNLLPLVEQADWYDQKLTLQVLNVVGFIFAMLTNGLSATLSDKISWLYDLSFITDDMDIRIAPAGYAFSIWGLIYSLLAVFVVY